ncbi:hypothetical protein [Angelakisella massiliensis]|nr:hypothetical protein [Angelakisella massiliensis]
MILPLKNLFSAVILHLSSENPFLAPDVSRETLLIWPEPGWTCLFHAAIV